LELLKNVDVVHFAICSKRVSLSFVALASSSPRSKTSADADMRFQGTRVNSNQNGSRAAKLGIEALRDLEDLAFSFL
jgi:hypothetical protein